MNAEQSIGEILAAALGPAAFDEVGAQVIAGRILSEQIAENEGRDYSSVWDIMTRLDDRLIPLLDSPAGWGALSAIVSVSLGGDGRPLNPSVH